MKKLGTPQPDSDVVNEQPRVLLIGYGWVNQYMGKLFTDADYVESDGVFKSQGGLEIQREEKYDLAIIGTPTPMNPETGQCDTSIVEECVDKYKDIVDVFLVKSTVEIGTCDRLAKKYNTHVCMSPEFVGETLGHPLVDLDRTQFQIVGGCKYGTRVISRMLQKVLHADAEILTCESREAEIIKYFENYWIVRRVAYWNEVYQASIALDANFEVLRNGLTLDPRLNRTHSNVYPENRGWAGKCTSKDMPALAFKMREIGSPLKALEFMIEQNAEVRKDYKAFNRLMPNNPQWKQPRKIKLSKGYEATVDADDYEWLNQWSWHYTQGYASRNIYIDGKRRLLRMHRLINDTPEELLTDHINRDKLDNRRENLRAATKSQNQINSFREGDNKSDYNGVCWNKSNKKWVSQISVDNKKKFLGYFDNKEEAARAYNEEAKKLHGEFAVLNKL